MPAQDRYDRLVQCARGREYGFSKRFGWTNDRLGVSWRLNLA